MATRLINASHALGSGIGQIPIFSDYQSSGIPGLVLSNRLIFARGTTSASDTADIQINRTANFSGGTAGNTNSALFVTTTASAGITSNEWSGLFQLLNNGTAADASQNVALYAQSRKLSTGKTWAAVSELRDSSTDPAAGSVTHEFDLWANGTDATGQRVILDVVGGKLPGGSGVTPTITRGLRIGAQNLTTANATFVRGISFAAATYTDLIGTESTPTTTNGVNLSSGTFSGNPFMSAGFSVDNAGNVTGKSFVPGSSTVPVAGVFLPFASQLGLAAGSTQVMRLANSNGGIAIIGTANNNSNDNLTVGTSAVGDRSMSMINANGGNGARSIFYLGNSNSGQQASIILNGGATASGNGANSLTIGNGSGMIAIGNSTETFKIGTSGAFSANGSVATVLGSLGPTGSHTTVQKWLTVTDNGGTVGYLPMF